MSKLIYALRSKTLNKIKIGESNLDAFFYRLNALQTGSADELELVGVHYGRFASDKDIHPILMKSHSHLEWFNENKIVKDFILSNFLIFPIPLSLLKNINSMTGQTISMETIAIEQYVKGAIKAESAKNWFDKFNMGNHLNSKLTK